MDLESLKNMTTLACDDDGNLLYSDQGFIVLRGDEALVQDIRTALKLHRGEYPFDPDQGVNYERFMSSNNKDILIDYIKTTIKNDPRVRTFYVRLLSHDKILSLEITIYTKWGSKVNV